MMPKYNLPCIKSYLLKIEPTIREFNIIFVIPKQKLIAKDVNSNKKIDISQFINKG